MGSTPQALERMFCFYSAPELLVESVGSSAPVVLGALADQAAETHSDMWAMVLAYMHALPAAWTAIDQAFFAKAVQPKLCTLLRYGAHLEFFGHLPVVITNELTKSRASGRNACFGTAASSMPALLPFMTLLPPELQSSKLYCALLDSVWSGWEAAPDAGSQAAAAACFQVLLGATRHDDMTSQGASAPFS